MSDSASESLFAKWLEARAQDASLDFDEFCAKHPEHAESLRSLRRYAEFAVREIPPRSNPVAPPTAHVGPFADQVDRIRSLGAIPERYAPGELIGRGGMGSVLRVEDKLLRRSLAMKILSAGDESTVAPTPVTDDRSLGRFLDEALVTARLDHPYIVPVHDLGVDAHGRVYFAMKRVKGEDLRAVFERIRAGIDGWSVTRGLQVLLKVCEAMAYAHDKGVVHRDLKPGNVMVGPFGEVYVMDWGLARILDRPPSGELDADAESEIAFDSPRRIRQIELADSPALPLVTVDGDVVGTPSYMPKEQAEGILDAIGPRSDIYAVGAMLYHLFAGTPPYVAPGERVSARTIWQRVRESAPRPLHELATDVPVELVAIVDRAMARDARDRYASMADLAKDLQAYLDVRVVSAYETGALAELKKWVQRNPALASAAGLLVAVLAVSTAIVLRKNTALETANHEISAQKSEVENQKTEVERRGEEVAKRKAEFDQLAGVVKLEDALRAEASLHPAWPDKISAMEHWLERDARDLLDLRPVVATTLAKLTARSSSSNDGAANVPSFADPAEAFLHRALSSLASDLDAFDGTTRRGVEQRLAWARSIESLTLAHPNARTTWQAAREAIARADGEIASKAYAVAPNAPIDLTPQIGLVPIGMNPVTKLWEFLDLRSSCDVLAGQDPRSVPIPVHRDDGSLDGAADTGIVFVLVPGGTHRMGSQASDPKAPNFDPFSQPDERIGDDGTSEVTLAPFFIARHELTQGQWQRLTGRNPSQYPSGTTLAKWTISPSNPVENVSWNDCSALLANQGCSLPTEAQWEYSCRAGTETPWWCGTDKLALAEVANLADATAKRVAVGWDCDLDLDDGFFLHAPVGSYRANPFGLYDMHGNVWEWCADYAPKYDHPAVSGTGERLIPDARFRVSRGGGFGVPPIPSRSSARAKNPPAFVNSMVGCRPVMTLRSPPP